MILKASFLFRQPGHRMHWQPFCLVVAALVFGPALCRSADGSSDKSDPAAVRGSELFENIHVVQWPRLSHGYRTSMGDMIQLQDGRFLLCYTLNVYPYGRDNGANIVGRYSSDGGKSWGEEFVIIPTPTPRGKHLYCHPSFLRLNNGDVLLAYIYSSAGPPWYGHNYFHRSTDDTKSWGDKFILTPSTGSMAVHNDKLIQLSSGRIVAPAAFNLVPHSGGHRGEVSCVYYSDDQGYRWNRSKNYVNALPVEAQEPAVVELKDGRLMMLCRTYHKFVLRSYSSDGGETWSPGEPIRELKLSPNSSALNVKRIPSTGDLLLLRSSGGTGGHRTPFVSAISRDDGKTWEKDRVIQGDPDEDYGYPSLRFLGNTVLISYHRRDGIHVARIGVDWFYRQEESE